MTTRDNPTGKRLWPISPGLLGLALFVLAAVFGDILLGEVVKSTDARKQARINLMLAKEVMSLLKDIESGQRGFLLTNDPSYLLPYTRGRAQVPAVLDTLRMGLAPLQEIRQMDAISRNIDHRLAISAELVNAQRGARLELGREAALLSEGKAAMDAIRTDFARLERQLGGRIQALDERVQVLQRRARIAGIALVSLAGLLLLLAYALLLREQARRVQAEQALTASAASLASLRGAELESVFEALPDLYFRLAADGVILDYRGNRDELYVAPEHFLGRRMQDVLPPEAGARFAASLVEFERGASGQTFEYPLDMPDGRHHYEARLGRLPNMSERVLVVRDVSARVQADLALHEARDDLRAFAAKLDRDIESERRRLAREVHDQLGQIFTALKLDLLVCRSGTSLSPANVDEFETLLDEGIRIARRISADLRPPLLDDLGLGPALAHLAQHLGRQAGFAAAVDIQPDARLESEQTNQLFRIAQEALTNVVRHAGASHVRIGGVTAAGSYRLSVEDDGCGIAAGQDSRLGMLGMRERAAQINAELDMDRSPLGGLRLTVSVPLIEGEASNAHIDCG